MAKAEDRWDYVETGDNRIRMSGRRIAPTPIPPVVAGEAHSSESREQPFAPNAQGWRRPLGGRVWRVIGGIRFWLIVKMVLLMCVCVVLVVAMVSLVDFLVDDRVGRVVSKLIGLAAVIVGFLIAKRQGFFR
jgi:hypothetical protein